MSERESWVKIHIWWVPSETVGTQHETETLSTGWTERQVHQQQSRLHEESQRKEHFPQPGYELITRKTSAKLWTATAAATRRARARVSWWRRTVLRAREQHAEAVNDFQSQRMLVIPAPSHETESAASSRLLQTSTDCPLSLWCYFPLKLTETCSSARSKSDPGWERFPSRQLKIVFSLAQQKPVSFLLLNSTWNGARETQWVKNETFKSWKTLRWCQRGRWWTLTLQRALCHTCFSCKCKSCN